MTRLKEALQRLQPTGYKSKEQKEDPPSRISPRVSLKESTLSNGLTLENSQK